MSQGHDPLFGMHGTALTLRSQRLSMLASNIANAATPGYKARDLDFDRALALAARGSNAAEAAGAATAYRVPLVASADGNTVELATEQLLFAENAVRYRSSLAFVESRISTLRRALKGE